MDYPVLLRASKVRDSATDYFIGNPHARNGLVARVYSSPNATRLFATAPDLKAALEAILRVEVGADDDDRTRSEALAEIRGIAAEALDLLYNPTDSNQLPRKKRVG